MKKISIVFVLGFNQKLILSELLKKIKESKVIICTVYDISDININNIDVIDIAMKHKSIFKIIKSFSNVIKLNNMIKSYDCVDLYTPFLLNFAVNKIYYSHIKKTRLFYLFEGILNYRDVFSFNFIIKKYQKRQFLKSLFIFHWFKMIKNEITRDNKLNLKALIFPKGAIVEVLKLRYPFLSLVELDTSNMLPTKIKEEVLVLEPPFYNKIERKIFQNKVFCLIREEYIRHDIFIKPHPSKQKTELKLNNYLNNDIFAHLLDCSMPAEELFFKRGCCAVISTNSSALLLIKSINAASKVYSISTGFESKNDPSLTEIKKMMQQLGIIFK